MSEVMERVRRAAARAAAGPLADAVRRPEGEASALGSPFGPEAGVEEYVARFRAELERLTGKVYGPCDAAGVAAAVKEILAAHEAKEALAWDVEELARAGLGKFGRSRVELVPGRVSEGGDRRAELERLAQLPVGLSGALAGLADTGSIVVASGPGRPRVASLLPPVHVAVLPVSRIYPTMAAWLARGGAELVRGSANVVVITGPSRTADIELTLALGVHGPKEVHVILADDGP